MSGLKKLLGSKRFWTAIIATLVIVVVEVFGVPEAIAEKVGKAVLTLATMLIGGISASDIALALKGNKKD
jgi:hypothetical protein